MKKFLLLFGFVLFLALSINFVIGPILASYVFNLKAGRNLAAGGLRLSYKRVQIGRIVSPHISVQNLKILDPLGFLRVSVPSLIVDSYWVWNEQNSRPNLVFDVQVGGLNVEMVGPKSTDQQVKKPESGGLSAGDWMSWVDKGFLNMSLKLALKSAGFRLLDNVGDQVFALDPFDLEVDFGELLKAENWLRILLKGQIKGPSAGGIPINVPVEVKTDRLLVAGQKISSESISLTLSGVSSHIKGHTDLGSGTHNWDLNLEIPSLLSLPIPKNILPSGRLFGGLSGVANFKKVPGQPIALVSNFQSKNFGGDLDHQSEKLSVKGRFLSDLSWDIKYVNEKIQARNIRVKVLADDLEIKSPPYFQKSKQDKFSADLTAYVAKNTLVVRTKSLQLNQLKFDLSTTMSLENDFLGSVRLALKPTRLDGLEKLFPSLAKQPMKGQVQLNAKANGRFGRGLEGISLSVQPIRLDKFQTSFNYRDDKSKTYAIGPVSGEVIGNIKTQGVKLQRIQLQANLDMTKMELDYQGQVEKKMGETLLLDADVWGRENSISIRRSKLKFGKAKLELTGKGQSTDFPTMDLRFKLTNLDTDRFQNMKAWPKALKADGVISADLRVSGMYDRFRGIEHSELAVQGSTQANFGRLHYLPPIVTAGGSELPSPEPAPLKTVPSFLPPWPIFQRANLSFSSQIEDFRFTKIKASRIGIKGLISKGGASIASQIGRIFSGKLKVKKLLIPLIWENPVIRGKASLENIDLASVLGEMQLDSMPRMTGLASGSLRLATELPQSQRFLSSLESKGVLSLKKFNLTEIRLMDSMLEPLRKLPGVEVKPKQEVKGFAGMGTVAYVLKKRKLDLGKLHLKNRSGDALSLKGTMDLSGPVNLDGSLSLVDPPIDGDIYTCNQDSQGRMKFPVIVKANYTSPSFQIPQRSVQALVNNTFRCQKKKLKAKVKTEAKKKLGEIESTLESEVGKQLKDLFN